MNRTWKRDDHYRTFVLITSCPLRSNPEMFPGKYFETKTCTYYTRLSTIAHESDELGLMDTAVS